MRILLAGGGTGGHLCPGLALAGEFLRDDAASQILFVGTAEGLDREMVPAAGYELEVISAGRGSPLSLSRPMNLPCFIKALFECRKIFSRFKPDVVVALGGFAAAAPGLVAALYGVPLVVLEQNTIPGRVNRLLSRWARQIHLQFTEAQGRFTSTRAAFYHSGSPLRSEFVAMANGPAASGDALLVMGGSQGARGLNDLVLNSAQKITSDTGCRIIHIAGAINENDVREKYKALGVDAEVYGFTDTASCLKRSRLAVSRSGAGAIAECAVAGLPSVLVPLPTSKDDHQRVNAAVAVDAGAALLFEQDGDAGEFAPLLTGLWNDKVRLAEMSSASRTMAKPQAGTEIVGCIKSMIGKGKSV